MKPLGEYEVWFLTGSQDLYGEDTLRQVADHAAQIAAGLDDTASVPVRVVSKPVVTSPDGIRAACVAASATEDCVGASFRSLSRGPGRRRPALDQLRLGRAPDRVRRWRPLFVRRPDSAFTLENFMRAMLLASLCAMRSGLDILTLDEEVAIEEIRGHGGFFRGGDTGQRIMAGALGIPVSIPGAAGEGGAWGMALLAAYMLRPEPAQSLPDYLDERIAGSIGAPVAPDPRDVAGFNAFYARHRKGLAIEREAVNSL